ncbi:MAG: AIM24 family protein [Myxococcota bacterium]
MTEEPSSALAALIRLDREQITRYCRSVEVQGAIAETVTLRFSRGQTAWCARGSLLAYSPEIEWALRIPGGAAKAVGRMLSGEGLSLTHVTSLRDDAWITLAANQPGRLATWDLSRGPIVCTAGSFVGAVGDVDIDMTMARSAGAMLFGGAGLFLQRLSGRGVAFVHGAGDFIAHELGPGEKMLVSTGNLAVFSGEVRYGVRGVGGCWKSLVGGEGLFMTELEGPGWVMLQSLKKTPPAAQGKGKR